LTAAGLLLAGCAPAGQPILGESATQLAVTEAATVVGTATSVPVPAALTESPTTISDPTEACPTPSGETALYVNREDGYCLLYPAYFSAQFDPNRPGRILQLIGPRQEAGPKMQETAGVFLDISLNGPPEGMDSRQYAAKWLALYAPGMPLEGQEAPIGGQTATIVGDLPGFIAQRGAFIVTPEGRYTLFLSPQPGDIPELTEHAARAWETVTGSLTFFEPQADREYRRAEEVCPQAAEGQALIDSINGYCLLYPADFELDPDIAGRIIGGPVLGNEEGFGDIRTSLAVGTFVLPEGQTPMDIVQERMGADGSAVDPATVEETTIAGYPAVTFRGPRQPWTHRQAFIGVDGVIYTIVAQPEEPERFAEGMPYLEGVWDMAVETLAFFTPWR
jgi:hypothetical protein